PCDRKTACTGALFEGCTVRARLLRVKRVAPSTGRSVTHRSCVFGQSHARELPARIGREEVSVAGSNMRARRGARAAAQDVLVDHEFAVVFAERARRGAEARIRRIRAVGPLPDIAKHRAHRGPVGDNGTWMEPPN